MRPILGGRLAAAMIATATLSALLRDPILAAPLNMVKEVSSLRPKSTGTVDTSKDASLIKEKEMDYRLKNTMKP